MAGAPPNKRYRYDRGVGGYISKAGHNSANDSQNIASAILGVSTGANKDYNNLRINTNGVSAAGDTDRPVEPVALYYKNNWEMMQSQPELMAHIYEHGDSYLSEGIAFVTDTGLFCDPTKDFKSLIQYYLMPALRRALMWFFCYGYVVWFKAEAHGREVPFVPDPCQVEVKHVYDALTGAPEVLLKWANNSVKSQLYYYKGSPFAVTPDFQCAPMDSVGPLIHMLNELSLTRLLTLNRVARPVMVIQESSSISRSNASNQNADAPTMNVAARYMLEYNELIGNDDALYDRLADMQERVSDAHKNDTTSAAGAIPPWRRLQTAVAEPASNRFVPIPSGMQAVNINTPVHDFDFNSSYKQILEQIDRLFGHSSERPELSKASANKWRLLLGDFATSIIRTLYHPDSFRLFDARPTWEEEKKLNETKKRMTVEDMFEDTVRDALLSSDEDGKSDYNDDGTPLTLAEKLRKESTTIRAILISHLLQDRDLAADYMGQGGISAEKFNALYPQN